MIRLTIGNSLSKISGLKTSQHRALTKLLTYTEKTNDWIKKIIRDKKTGKKIARMVPKVIRHPQLRPDGVFPTGLLYIVTDWLQRVNPYVVTDTREAPRLNRMELTPTFTYPPYPEQLEAAIVAQDEHRGIIVGPTGVGKSYIVALIIKALEVPTLVVVPTLALKAQLIDSLNEIFGADTAGPLSLSGQKMHFITVENYSGLDVTKKIEGIDCLIIDEFHHAGAATYRTLNEKTWHEIYYRFGLTATPFRSDESERLLLESVLSHEIYRIPYQVAVDKGYIVPIQAYVYNLPIDEDGDRFKSYHGAYNALVVENEFRNELIAHISNNLIDAGVSTLILTKQVDHGEILQNMIGVPFAEGKNTLNKELIAQFNCQDCYGLIGTEGILGEGVDTKPCEYVIDAAGGKAKTRFMQKVGRALRRFGSKEQGVVILFRDDSNQWLSGHYQQCATHLLEEYGITPTVLTLPDALLGKLGTSVRLSGDSDLVSGGLSRKSSPRKAKLG